MSEIDLLVIGAGACGLAGAIAAHDAGLSVAIVEKRDRPGGNSSLSTGSIPGAGTKYQRAAGIEDSPERMVADLLAVSGHHDADDGHHGQRRSHHSVGARDGTGVVGRGGPHRLGQRWPQRVLRHAEGSGVV